eukprot:TRINITY_DN15918_c0_g1_i4.p1 TRINITY_DN15918_c0_g1~~TRINITY_DN15918_c0_g1_i4.p1  ORF type:complete len:138 (+),score=22.38 TRINITY_DN15918_c0_g1_i4:504-917(+)
MLLSMFRGVLAVSPAVCDLKDAIDICFTRIVTMLDKNQLSTTQVVEVLENIANHIEVNRSTAFDGEKIAEYIHGLYLSRIDLNKLTLEELLSILLSFYKMNALLRKYFSPLYNKGMEKMKAYIEGGKVKGKFTLDAG